MPPVLIPLGVALLTYLLGCFSTGYYLVRLRTGQDLRTIGSGATGGRNVARVLGTPGFLITGGGDLAKAAIAVGVPIWFGLGPVAIGAALVAVTAGHIWPIQLGFRGGKGVAPLVGSTALVAPIALAIGVGLGALFVLVSRRLNLGGLAGVALTPVAALALGAPIPVAAGILGSVVLVIVAHRSNIRAELTTAPSFGRLLRPVSRVGRSDG
jgi:acyl phosphate:glycerol-3-phosphate acyltransferase